MVTAGRFMGGTQLSHQRRPFHLDRILPPLNSLHVPILRLELQLRPALPGRRHLLRGRHADLHHNQDARHQFRDVRLLYRVRCPFLSPSACQKSLSFIRFFLYVAVCVCVCVYGCGSPQLSAAQAHQDYYGSAITRLQSIKSQVDPGNTFSFPQAIGQ